MNNARELQAEVRELWIKDTKLQPIWLQNSDENCKQYVSWRKFRAERTEESKWSWKQHPNRHMAVPCWFETDESSMTPISTGVPTFKTKKYKGKNQEWAKINQEMCKKARWRQKQQIHRKSWVNYVIENPNRKKQWKEVKKLPIVCVVLQMHAVVVVIKFVPIGAEPQELPSADPSLFQDFAISSAASLTESPEIAQCDSERWGKKHS